MGAVIIILIGIIGVGAMMFQEGKRVGYNKGMHDGYEECKRNYNKIEGFKDIIRNNFMKNIRK